MALISSQAVFAVNEQGNNINPKIKLQDLYLVTFNTGNFNKFLGVPTFLH